MSEPKKEFNTLEEVIKLEVQVIALQKALRQIMDNNTTTLAVPSSSALNHNYLQAVEQTKIKYQYVDGIDEIIY